MVPVVNVGRIRWLWGRCVGVRVRISIGIRVVPADSFTVHVGNTSRLVACKDAHFASCCAYVFRANFSAITRDIARRSGRDEVFSLIIQPY